jgi:apolipoprotein D and lipocalin family protein
MFSKFRTISPTRRQMARREFGGRMVLSLGLFLLSSLSWLLWRNQRQANEAKNSLKTSPDLDLHRFAGKWFEIARLPGKHQNVAGMTLTYTVNTDHSLDLVCAYHDHTLEGPEHLEHRHIRMAEANHARFKKQLFGPFSTDYWVLEVGKHYQYAVLGTPSRKHLWILSRRPEIDERLYQSILERMQIQGFAIDRLMRVVHDPHTPVALSSHLQSLLERKQAYFREDVAQHHGPQKQEKHINLPGKPHKSHHRHHQRYQHEKGEHEKGKELE